VSVDVSANVGPVDLTVTNSAGESAVVSVIANMSADGTTTPPAAKIVDASGNLWTVDQGHAAKNGAWVSTGSPTAFTELVYWGGVIYGHNATGWVKNTAAPWVATTDPRPAAPTITMSRPLNNAVSGSLCTVSGTTNQTSVTIKDGSTVLATVVPAADGTFSKQVRLSGAGARNVNVAASSATASATVNVGSALPAKIFYGMNGHMCYADGSWSTYSKASQLAFLKDLGCTMYRADVASGFMADVIKTQLSAGGSFYNQGIGFIPVLNAVSAGWTTGMTETAAYNLGKSLGVAVATSLNGLVDYIECGNELDVPIKIGGNGSQPSDWSQTTWPSYRGVLRGMYDGVKSINTDIQVGVNIGIPMAYGALIMLWNGTEPNGTTGKPKLRWDFTAYHWYESSGDIEHAGGPANVNIPQLLKDQFGVPTIFTEWGWQSNTGNAPAYVTNAMTQYRNSANFKDKYGILCIMQYCMIDPTYGLVQADGVTKNPAYTTAKNFIAANPA
jgi:hypothetical protein